MKRTLLFLSLAIFFASYGSRKKGDEPIRDNFLPETSVQAAFEKDSCYFLAHGTDPSWELKIFNNTILLKTETETLVVPHVAPISVQNTSTKQYQISTEAATLEIDLVQKPCNHVPSTTSYPYTVTLAHRKNIGETCRVLEGCGTYTPDPRLYDIWVLEMMNGKGRAVLDPDCVGMPIMEIDTRTCRFLCSSMCNHIMGKVLFKKDAIHFTNVASTRRACPNLEAEYEFIEALQRVVFYRIEDLRLYLSTGDSEDILVFRKID